MDFNFNWFFEIKHNLSVKGVLAIAAFSFSIISFVISFFVVNQKFRKSLSKKIATSFLIASIAYMSDSGFAYSIAIFIIATMITRLDFIENIAGIMRDSKNWLEYRRAQLGVASPTEKEKIRVREPKEIKEENKEIINEQTQKLKTIFENQATATTEQYRGKTSVKSFNEFTFEQDVLEKLEEERIFETKINRAIKLQFKGEIKYIFDAFARTEDTDIIIETKLVRTETGIGYVVNQIKLYIQDLQLLNLANKRQANVKGLIIIPASEITHTIQGNIAILKYDIDNKKFINLDEIRQWSKY